MLSKDYDEGDMGCTGIYRLRSFEGLGFERLKKLAKPSFLKSLGFGSFPK